MGALYVSTSYLASILTQPIMQSQSALATATAEESTGQYADLGLQLGDRSGYELSLKNQAELLQSLTTSNSVLSTNMSTAQAALDSIRSTAQATVQALTGWQPGGNAGASLQSLGANGLQALIASANTSSGDAYVFGGVNSAAAPMANYFSTPSSSAKTAIDAAFQSAFGFPPTSPSAASISPASLQAFLNGPFAAQFQGAAWTANWSSAASTDASAQIAPNQFVTTSADANQPGFHELAQAYAMLSEFGGSQLSGAAMQSLAASASTLITQGATTMAASEAALGQAQARVNDANSSMASQLTILQTQIGALDNVDESSTAVKINSLTTQIQTAYELTSRIHQLNLAQYLPVS